MAITAADTSSGRADNTTTLTISDLVISGTDKVLAIPIAVYENASAASRVVTSVTCGGVACTNIPGATINEADADGESVEQWYLVAPADGTPSIVVTVTGTCNRILAYPVLWNGASQTGVPNTQGEDQDATGTTHATSLTTTADGCGIAGCIYTWDSAANGSGTGQNLIASLDGDYSRGSYEIVGAAGVHDHSYTTGSNSRTIMSAVAYAPAAVAGTSVKDIIGGFIPFAR